MNWKFHKTNHSAISDVSDATDRDMSQVKNIAVYEQLIFWEKRSIIGKIDSIQILRIKLLFSQFLNVHPLVPMRK